MADFGGVQYEKIGNADVYLGENMASVLPSLIPDEFKAGHIALLYFDEEKTVAEKVLANLKTGKIDVYECKLDSGLSDEKSLFAARQIPEYVRYVIGVGTERTANICSAVATSLNVDFALFVTAPSSDRFLFGTDETVDTKIASLIVADIAILEDCPKPLLAAGWGIALAERLRIFEKCVADKTSGKSLLGFRDGESIAEVFKRTIKQQTIDLSPNVDELFWYLLNLSERKRNEKFKGGVETFCEILQLTDKTRERGEYMFIASYVLWGYYKCFLSSSAFDVLLPPDKIKSMKLLEKKCGLSFNLLLKRIDFLTVNSYFRIKYILEEYRLDLLSCLEEIDYSTSQRRWRRIYDDAGFWLKENFSSKELLSIMALAGETSKGLLGYAKATGALEDYI